MKNTMSFLTVLGTVLIIPSALINLIDGNQLFLNCGVILVVLPIFRKAVLRLTKDDVNGMV